MFNKYRLKELRNKKGLTQEGLADKLNTTKGTISNYENGHSAPDGTMLSLLADVLNTTSDYLLNRTSAPSPIDRDHEMDQEWLDLHESLKQKGAELEATAILRTASKMNKNQLKDILRVFEMIEKDED